MIYKFKHLEAAGLVRHGFSTRLGGVSTGRYASMNMGFGRGDSDENVYKNYEILCGRLSINVNNIVFSAQTHKTNILPVTKADCGNGILNENKFNDIDGLVTNEKETALVTFHADCVPLFFLDPVKKVIALAHAGWRGTIYKIAEKAVRLMSHKYSSEPADILVGIGPSIGRCCFETDEPVYSLFEKTDFARNHVYKTRENKRSIDLWGVNREILENCGIKRDNIEIMGLCTKCEGNIFFSHRNMGENRGSLIAIMELI